MCGIVAVLRAPTDRPVPSASELLDLLDRADAALGGSPGEGAIRDAADALASLDGMLRGLPGVLALVNDRALVKQIEQQTGATAARVVEVEAELDAGRVPGAIEAINAALLQLKDSLWAVRKDRLRTARAVAGLAGAAKSEGALASYLSIQIALSAIDRLEVRGRDSAGLHVLVDGHGLDLGD